MRNFPLRLKGRALGCLLAVLSAWFPANAPAAFGEDFSRWDSGKWEVIREPGAADVGHWVQEKEGILAGDEGQGILNLLHRSLSRADLSVEARVSFAGQGAPALLLRVQGNGDEAGDAYSVVLYRGGINLWRRIDGVSTKVAQSKFAPPENKPCRLRASVEGWRIRVWLDDTLHIDAEDAAIPGSGRAGIWAGEGPCRFSSFSAEAAAATPSAAEPVEWPALQRRLAREEAWAGWDGKQASLTWGGECSGRRMSMDGARLGCAARSSSREGSHYNGLMVPVAESDLGGRELVMDLRSSTPENTQAVYVRLYDAGRKRVASWSNWRSPLARGPLTLRLEPGQTCGDFVWEPKQIEREAATVSFVEVVAGTRVPEVEFDLSVENLRTAPLPVRVSEIAKVKSLSLETPLVAGGRPVAVLVASATHLELARQIQHRVRELSGAELPVVEDSSLADAQGRWNEAGRARRGESLVLLGNLETNRLQPLLYARLLTAVDSLYPGPGGFALHSIHDPWGNGRNVVLVGGSDPEGVRAATGRLLDILSRQPAGPELKLPRMLDVQISADLLKTEPALGKNPDEKAIAQSVEKAREAFSRGQHTGVTTNLYQVAFQYARSGREGYAELFKRLARLMMEIYRSNPGTYGGPWGMDADFHSMQVIAGWDLVEESPGFTEAERLEMTRILATYAEDLGNHGNVRGAVRPGIRHNHNTFPCLGVLFAAEYFGKYYGVAEAAEWLAASDACFQEQALSFKPQEDSNGYQWLTTGHLMRYALARPDHRYFTTGNARRTLDLALLTMDNLGYQSAFGDVGGWRGWASEVPLWSMGAWYFSEPAYRWGIDRERAVQPQARAAIGGFACTGVPSQPPAGFEGMRVFPMERRFHDFWAAKQAPESGDAWVAPVEQTYEKISFRGGHDPMQPYLLLDGIGCGGHRHYDGNAFIRYSDRGREWFADGDYIKALPKFHTSLLAFRDGQSSALPPFCALEARADLPGMALARSTVRNYGGVDWSRNLFWIRGHGFAVIDSVQARSPGDYAFRTVWHTLGEPGISGQRYTVEQQGERFVLDNLDGARLKLTSDASLGKNWNGYPHAPPVVRILQQQAQKTLREGECHHFLNVFGTSPVTGEHPVQAARASDTSLLVTAGGETNLVGVNGEGKLRAVAKEVGTDALLYALRPRGFTLAQATRLEVGGRPIFQADAPVSVEFDAASGHLTVESPGRRHLAVAAGPGASLVEREVAPGRQEVQFPGSTAVLMELPAAVPLPARAGGSQSAKPAWPLRWKVPGAFTCLAAADLDGDGRTETVTGDGNGRLVCLDAAGKVRWEVSGGKAVSAVWAGDLEGDGHGEVLAGSVDGSLALYDASSRSLWTHSFPYYKRTPGVRVLFPADLDGDGKSEIIAGTDSWHFYALDRGGKERWHYESVHGSTCGTAVDFEGRGRQGVLAGTEYYWWHAVSPEGKKRWEYSSRSGPQANAVAAGDLNGDGKPEAVFGGADGNLHVLSEAGKLLWQCNTGDEVTAVAVRDLDGDGKAEVMATSMSFNLYVFDGTGKIRWRRDHGDVLRDLALLGDKAPFIAVAGEDGRVVVCRAADGSVASETACGSPLMRVLPAEFDGNPGPGLVALSQAGEILALEENGR